jgi:hypothetical protein
MLCQLQSIQKNIIPEYKKIFTKNI